MTDAEQSPVFFAEGGGGTWMEKAIHLEEANRTLKAEVEKRDRVVEAARLKLAAEDKVNGNIAFGEHDEDAARANWRAWTNLAAALSALDQEDTP